MIETPDTATEPPSARKSSPAFLLLLLAITVLVVLFVLPGFVRGAYDRWLARRLQHKLDVVLNIFELPSVALRKNIQIVDDFYAGEYEMTYPFSVRAHDYYFDSM